MDTVFPQTRERIAEWASRPDVLGVLLVGSRSRGNADELSDDDLEVILTDEAAAAIAPADCSDVLVVGERPNRKMIYDAQYLGLSALKAKKVSSVDLDHWPYESAPVLYDRDGTLAGVVQDLGRMEPDFRAKRLRHATIDAWIPPYRAGKCLKRGQVATAHLLVVRGARALIRLAFALERRWVPLDHWLEPELRSLKDEAGVVPHILAALMTLEATHLESGLATLEEALASEGVPRPAGRNDLFMELIHPANVEERAIHALG
jgi:predicted nucleotidyltransferase